MGALSQNHSATIPEAQTVCSISFSGAGWGYMTQRTWSPSSRGSPGTTEESLGWRLSGEPPRSWSLKGRQRGGNLQRICGCQSLTTNSRKGGRDPNGAGAGFAQGLSVLSGRGRTKEKVLELKRLLVILSVILFPIDFIV